MNKVTNSSSQQLQKLNPAGQPAAQKSGCSIANPQADGTRLVIEVTGQNGKTWPQNTQLSIKAEMFVCGQRRVRVFPVLAEDEVTFQLPDDLYWTTEAMLNGSALFYMYLAMFGWDREP